MKKIIFSFCLSVVILTAAKAQQEITYEVSFPNVVHHEAQISLFIPNVPAGNLKVRMSRSSPGRYATHEFGKNIYRFKAFDANGKLLSILQPQGDVYEIVNPGKSVKVTYTLFGNWIDGTYAGFDETHAHINIPAVFAFPVGMDKRPRLVKFNYSEQQNWKVATQLKPLGNNTYYAPNFQYFMDSPVEISDHKTASWEVNGPNGKAQQIHLVSHSNDTQETVTGFANMLKKLVAEQTAVWNELPVFDYGNYYFLHDVLPSYAGDGMEHRNSTSIVQRTAQIKGFESNLLGTFSHEFFHAWNVERLRPQTLEPFNFEHANSSDALWIAEGFTQYYGNLTLARAGFRSLDNITQTFNGIVNTVLNSPGARNFSPIEASRYAVFADAGVAIDQTNKANIFASYYTYGAGVAMALDLRLRASYQLTLDDYMRALWKAYGKTEIAYSISDLEKTLAQLTKDQKFANQFFKDYVYGTAKNDYAGLLLNAGFILRKANPNKVYTGFGRLSFENGKITLPQTAVGSPAYEAGLDFGDVLLSLNGLEVKDQDALNKLLETFKPGDIVQVKYNHHGIEKTSKLQLIESPDLEIVSIEKTGGTLSPAMQSFRESWLNTQIKN